MVQKLVVLLVLTISSFQFLPGQSDPKATQMLSQMIESARKVKTIRYHAIMNERIKGKMVEKNSFFKINTEPHKVYVRQSFIGIKLDALYCKGWNNDQLLVATVGFPWIKLSLDPKGSKVRDNHHHTLFEAGFTYFTNVIDDVIRENNPNMKISYAGMVEKLGKKCHKIVIDIDHFEFVPYTVKAGENVTKICEARNINDYMVVERNPDVDGYNDVKPGQVINIPNVYGKKLVLYIDPQLMLPAQIEIFDDKGLYGVYSYDQLIVNKPFQWDEFSATFKEYHF